VDSGSVVPEIRRAFGKQGQALLARFNLLKPLVEKMIIRDVASHINVAEDQLQEARLGLLQQRGYDAIEQWAELLEELGSSEDDVLERLRDAVRRRVLMRERFAPKAEARFLERKNELDQVVYSLLRLADNFLARELYLQIESGESNFADLAKRYAEGPERNTNGIVGPVSLTQAHPVLVEKLRVAQPGVLLEPFRISDWWLVVRLERYSPATFTPEVSDRMCREMFDAWIEEQTATTLNRLEGEFSDFSIS
jgi:parvulin-like peptidyl-prolyl isomerase